MMVSVPHGVAVQGSVVLRYVSTYACERAGHAINWTAVEATYTDLPQKGLPR